MPRSPFTRVTNYLQNHKLFPLHLLSNRITTDSEYPQKNHYKTWTNVISGLTQNDSNSEKALLNASQMLNSGIKPNGRDLVHLIRTSTKTSCYSFGQQLHCYTLRSGFYPDVILSTSLINFYIKLDSLSDAHNVFVDIPQPNVVSWNSLISGCVKSGQLRNGLSLFVQLGRSEVCADSYSFTAALSACGQLSLLRLGESIHTKVVKRGVEYSVLVANCLIDMYGKSGAVKEAIQVFNQINDKDIISWNLVISASARNQKLEQAVNFLLQMPKPDTISYNELINGFAQFGTIDDAIKILANMPSPNSSSWNSIITGYVNRGKAWEALNFFSEMHSNDIEMNQFTFSSILSGIASLSALAWGILVHCCTIKCGLNASVVVGSALLDVYSKCGKVENAELIFKSLPKKNLVTWNAMISGFAHNGNSNKVIELYEELKLVKDLKPDGITFLNVLSACWHNQAPFEIAHQYFESMINDYEIDATPEHCASMIRLMGKWGEVWMAERMIYELGFGSCGLVWRALLGASGTCGDLKVAELAAAKVFKLEGDKEFVYVMMSNIYAACEKWGDISVTRDLMKQRSVSKEVGCSWIEIDHVITA